MCMLCDFRHFFKSSKSSNSVFVIFFFCESSNSVLFWNTFMCMLCDFRQLELSQNSTYTKKQNRSMLNIDMHETKKAKYTCTRALFSDLVCMLKPESILKMTTLSELRKEKPYPRLWQKRKCICKDIDFLPFEYIYVHHCMLCDLSTGVKSKLDIHKKNKTDLC